MNKSKARMILGYLRSILKLPSHLQPIIIGNPPNMLRICTRNDSSFSNRMKATVEDYTGLEWDCWPLGPRIPDVGFGQARLEWLVSYTTGQ
jgi:hypothetical protein